MTMIDIMAAYVSAYDIKYLAGIRIAACFFD